jgi:dihydroneopterin aldolase
MIVEVHGLELFGRHGVNDDERRDGQTFLFDVTLEIAEPKEDAIEATIDYRHVRDIVRGVNDAESYRLLETLAAAVAAYERGATILRAHDVREHVEALTVAAAVVG